MNPDFPSTSGSGSQGTGTQGGGGAAGARGAGGDPARNLAEVGARVREDLELLRDTLVQGTRQARGRALGFVEEHPYAAVGAAFGVGFILAGGLFSRTTLGLVSFGTRFMAGRVLRNLLAGAGAGFLLSKELQGAGAQNLRR